MCVTASRDWDRGTRATVTIRTSPQQSRTQRQAAIAARSSSTVASDARWPHSIVDVVGAGSARWAPQTSTRIQKDRAAGPVTVSQLQCHACFIQQTRAHADQSNDGAHDASCRVDRDARSPATSATVARYQDIRAQPSQQNTQSVCHSLSFTAHFERMWSLFAPAAASG